MVLVVTNMKPFELKTHTSFLVRIQSKNLRLMHFTSLENLSTCVAYRLDVSYVTA
jgi:hypothetical protein